MNIDAIREFCLSLPNATEDIQWENDLLFRIGGKIFAVVGLESSTLCFKCTPEEFNELILVEGIIPAPYLARYKWVLMERDDVMKMSEVKRRLKDSYDMVYEKLPKKVKQKLKQK